MYRASSHVIRNAMLMIRRRSPVELRAVVRPISGSRPSLAWYKRHRERDPCPPAPPPPLPPIKVPYFLIGTALTLLVTAGYIVYAKQNPEVRDWLSINAPWFDDIIAVVFQENQPISESVVDYLTCWKAKIDEYMKELPEECKTGVKPVSISNPPPSNAVVDDTSDDDEDDDDEEEDEEVCILPSQPVVTKDVCKVEECLKDAAEDTIYNYMTARDYCNFYNKSVRECMGKFTLKCMKQLEDLQSEKDDVIDKYICDAKIAEKRFNELSAYVECGIEAPEDRLNVTRQMVKDFDANIKRIRSDFTRRHLRTQEFDKQWRSVKCLIDEYLVETSSIYPELDYSDEELHIYKDLDYLMIHAKKYIDKLNHEMIDTSLRISNKINRAYNGLPPPPKGKEKEREYKLQAAIKKARADMDKRLADREALMRKENDEEFAKQLKLQKERGEISLKEKLEKSEKLTSKKAEKYVKETLDAEKRKLKLLLDDMKAQLITVEQKLEERLQVECESKRAQMLHRASSRLLQATKRGESRVKVQKELEILRQMSTHDKLVTTVLSTLPPDVEFEGVVPESVVRNRYRSMEDIAMKVAMVEAEGGHLPLYAFSWVQSKILFMKPSNIPQSEIDNPPKEPFENLDTFDLLQRARYFMEHGNLANAVRYIDALEGASRGAAESWYQNANNLLQTRQAAEAILAHAAAINLKYI